MVEQAKAVSVGGSTYTVKHPNRRACLHCQFSLLDSLRLQNSEQRYAAKGQENPVVACTEVPRQSAIASPSTAFR